MSKVYQIITDKIIEKLEAGVVPWRRPWNGGGAVNWVSQKEYRGLNYFLLEGGEYATFNQVKKAGGQVRKGARSEVVSFFKIVGGEEVVDKWGFTSIEGGYPVLRYYRVFNIKDCIGIKSKRAENVKHDHKPIEKCESLVKGYKDAPEIGSSNRAYYRPSSDLVGIPDIGLFPEKEEYYSTLFHELTHSTGHRKRLNRPEVNKMVAFGDKDYSKEELVAEMGASMLCGVAGIDTATLDNSASYIDSWLKRLRNDRRLVVSSASLAQKAVDYIRGIKPKY